MIPVFMDYASPSAFESTRDRAMLGLSSNRRRPVRFRARVKREHRLGFRFALEALADVIWSADEWLAEDDFRALIYDPIITVHPDAVLFEGFSQDQSAYARVRFSRDIFEPEGEVTHGTTNVDFSAWLRASLAEMRSSRETWLRVEPDGFEVKTRGAGGRYEKKVEIPEPWIRAFLTLQAAMRMPGTRLEVRPVDLLATIRFLAALKAKVSPRALRYVMTPGEDAKVVLEPYEHVVPLVRAEHTYAEERVIRTWGRRRLKLLEPLLPYADRVRIYLKGRALPHFYGVELPSASFLLGLSGWSENRFSQDGGIALLSGTSNAAPPRAEATIAELARRFVAPISELDSASVDHLVRAGRALFDLETREVRHRELFDAPIDLDKHFAPDAQLLASRTLAKVAVTSVAPRATSKTKRLKTPEGPVFREIVFRDWHVFGSTADQPEVELVLSEAGRLIFGKCGCAFFQENTLNKGPCAHMLALLEASAPMRKDLPSSSAAEAPPPVARPPRERVDDDEDVEDNDP